MYGKKMYKKGGGDSDKKEEVRKIKRKLDSYTPQTQRKSQERPDSGFNDEVAGRNTTPPKKMRKMGGAKDHFADVVARAKKAKKPR